MIKVLSKSGFVEYVPHKGSRLTANGQQLALDVLRRHRLVELFLVKVLGLDWSEIHAEAECLEHAISHKLIERIDEFLGSPTTDPHGDPIPSADGEITDQSLTALSNVIAGATVRVARVIDQNPEFLRHLQKHGLVPGNPVTVTQSDPLAGAITVRSGDAPQITLGITAAAKILVEPRSPEA